MSWLNRFLESGVGKRFVKGQRVSILGFMGQWSLFQVFNSAQAAGKQPWTICK